MNELIYSILRSYVTEVGTCDFHSQWGIFECDLWQAANEIEALLKESPRFVSFELHEESFTIYIPHTSLTTYHTCISIAKECKELTPAHIPSQEWDRFNDDLKEYVIGRLDEEGIIYTDDYNMDKITL